MPTGRVGILGGTFDPIHHGHLLIAHAVAEALALERVLLMPAAHPPHKAHGASASAAQRMAMLRLAIAGDPQVDILTLELDSGGVCYAVDTMHAFRQRYADCEPVFIIGMDSLRDLHLWHDVNRLLQLCAFAVVDRPGVPRPASPSALRLPAPWPERLLASLVETRTWDVSSSEIRRRVAEGRSIRYLVPAAVEAFILAHGVYRAPM